ncbi:MAG: restriction endonuclease subunit S [Pseudomonas neustonica]
MVRLGDLFDFKNGRSFKKSEWKSSGLPIIRIQNLNDISAAFNYFQSEYDKAIEVNSGDLLFSWSGTVGSSFGPHIWEREQGVLNQHIFKLNFKTDMVTKYAYFALLFITTEIERSVVGAVGLVHVTKKSLNEYKIPAPSVDEQKRIVAILDQAFADIDKARALTEQNLKNARELFESYLQQVFNRRGEGWTDKYLHEFCTFSSGGTPSKENDTYWEGNIPWISGRDMKSTQLSDSLLHITQAAVDESSTRMAQVGAILVLVRGMGLAHGAQVAELLAPSAFNQDIKGLHPESGIVPRFLVFALRHQINSSENVLSNAAHGTLKIDMDALKNLVIALPTEEQQKEIVAQCNLLIEQRDQLELIYKTKLESLDNLKKSLLQKAFSGELTKRCNEVAA